MYDFLGVSISTMLYFYATDTNKLLYIAKNIYADLYTSLIPTYTKYIFGKFTRSADTYKIKRKKETLCNFVNLYKNRDPPPETKSKKSDSRKQIILLIYIMISIVTKELQSY